MRFRLMGTIMALGAVACGGERQAEQTPPPGGQPAMSAMAVEVRMTGNGTTQAAFEPAAITIAPGTTVRFVNVAGGPHNVAFWADSIPAGAAAVLNAAMPDRVADLNSRYATTPNETLEVSFAGAPTGAYRAYCAPHLALGMKIAITVQ
jgi:plastocyanin